MIKEYDQRKSAMLAELAKDFAFWDSYVSNMIACDLGGKLTELVRGTPWAYESESTARLRSSRH